MLSDGLRSFAWKVLVARGPFLVPTGPRGLRGPGGGGADGGPRLLCFPAGETGSARRHAGAHGEAGPGLGSDTDPPGTQGAAAAGRRQTGEAPGGNRGGVQGAAAQLPRPSSAGEVAARCPFAPECLLKVR